MNGNEFLPLYQSGNFEEALKALLASTIPKDANFYYNLGTTELRLGMNGKAVAHLEKASRMRGYDADAQHNLNAARTALGRVLGTERLDPASTWADLFSDRMASPEVQGACSLLAFVLLAFATRHYFRFKKAMKGSRETAFAWAAAGLLMLAATLGSATVSFGRPAAFTVERQQIRSGPGDHFLELSQVEAGVTLRLMGPQSEGWKQVRFSSDQIGWIKGAAILE